MQTPHTSLTHLVPGIGWVQSEGAEIPRIIIREAIFTARDEIDYSKGSLLSLKPEVGNWMGKTIFQINSENKEVIEENIAK